MPQLYYTMQKDGLKAGTIQQQRYPETRAEAIAAGLPKYWPGTTCPVCKQVAALPAIYVKSGEYTCCANEASYAAYNEYAVRLHEPITAAEAMERKLDFYWVPESFPNCGHPGKTTLKGTCYQCKHERENSPRQLAVKAGEIWYTPHADDLCAKCGAHARRRVSNGSCENCERLAKPQDAVEVPYYEQYPDMILSYEDAVLAGLKYYRTGERCKYGHIGWRYVSTRSCIDCANHKRRGK